MPPLKANIPEERYETYLRDRPLLLPVISFAVLVVLYTGIVFCMIGFTRHQYWTILPAALMAHAYFIICIHDGSHRAITRSKWDDLFMNVFAGLLLIPFFAEPFRRYHLIHHANTNTENDPLWSPVKATLFSKYRYFYILCQFIPLLFTLFVLMTSEKSRKEKQIKGPEMRCDYMFLAFLCSGIILYFFTIPLFFFLGTLLILTIIGAIRHWCEHMGTVEGIESNTFWFPLGMGVGNHHTHHLHPSLSWLSLAMGLKSRTYETNPFKTVYQMMFKKGFKHYKAS